MQHKPTKTLSGVTPIAVMLPPRPCPHGTCLYCPTFHKTNTADTSYNKNNINPNDAPQSYTPESPAVIRARECNYDPKKQIKARLKSYTLMKHPTQKIELIIMGGTFLAYPKTFQKQFIKSCYDALNNKKSKSLDEAKSINETALHRCVALCIETRPDFCTTSQINKMLAFGTTRIELGVQAIDNKIYKKVNRGHTIQDVIEATLRLKRAGFKVGYHIMPGMPGSSPKHDIKMFKKLFSSPNFKPDQIKIYPCQVLKNSGLENLYYQREYIPYDKQTTTDIIIKMLYLTPRYCRIMRIMREIPPYYLVAGIKNIDMRHDIEKSLNKTKILSSQNKFSIKHKLLANRSLNEIRFREIGLAIRDNIKIDPKTKLKTTKYTASKATEYFIEITNSQNILFGLLRLRLEKSKPAIIRELHVYGQAKNILSKNKDKTDINKAQQHLGLGKQLMRAAEKIAKQKRYKKILVISGVGVRQYYKELEYTLDASKTYMEKSL